jgi:diguanylate cyclase (GGDEF)-like protein
MSGKAKINIIEKWVQDENKTVWLSASKHPLFDEQGLVIGTWGTSRDISLLKNTEEQLELLNQKLQDANQNLERLSINDSLSGLYNHRHFYDSVDIAFSKADRYANKKATSGFSIVLFDIDHFKDINDTYGHLMGDLVIKQIGEHLNKHIRIIDTSYRYGGDEFAVIKISTDRVEAYSFAEKIRAMIADLTIRHDDIILNITISVGVVTSDEANSVNELMELVDKRMYQSKTGGRNRVT